jgi:phage-related holin
MYTNYSDIINNTIEPTAAKALVSILITIGFFFGDIHLQGIMAVGMLLIFDTVFGVMASWYEKEPITSRRLSAVVRKGTVYFMAISAGYFTDLTIAESLPLLDSHAVQSLMIGFIGVTEFSSIIENMGRMGYETPKKLLNQLPGFKSLKTKR